MLSLVVPGLGAPRGRRISESSNGVVAYGTNALLALAWIQVSGTRDPKPYLMFHNMKNLRTKKSFSASLPSSFQFTLTRWLFSCGTSGCRFGASYTNGKFHEQVHEKKK